MLVATVAVLVAGAGAGVAVAGVATAAPGSADGRCAWLPTAIALARGVAAATPGSRPAGLRERLAALGVTADTELPPECRPPRASGASTPSAAAGVLPAGGVKVCDKFGSAPVPSGGYEVQNDVWGSDRPQCVRVFDTGFEVLDSDFTNTDKPAAYPSIVTGCNHGTCTAGTALPKPVNQLGPVTTSWTVTIPPDQQKWNAAYDIWISPTGNDAGDDGTEMMIWLDHGDVAPIGEPGPTVSLAGRDWTVWSGTNGAVAVISYVATVPTRSVTGMALGPFFADALARGQIQPDWKLTSIQAGFEPWTRGAGLATNSFAVTGVTTTGNSAVAAATGAPATGTDRDAVVLPGAGPTWRVSTDAQLRDALAAVAPGSTIVLAAGRYGPVELTGAGTPTAPITLVGEPGAILDGGAGRGYTVHLRDAAYWQLVGFTITGGAKGLVADRTRHSVLDHLSVGDTGAEAVHLRAGSSDNTLQHSMIHDTGRTQPQFGEGVYLGSARSNWATVSNGQPDRSLRNRILDNTFRHITAENVDVKEGTSTSLIGGNRFDGSATSGANYADSVVDVKGVATTVTNNLTTGRSPALKNIIETHVVTDAADSGCGNTITGNTVEGFIPDGTLVALDPKCGSNP